MNKKWELSRSFIAIWVFLVGNGAPRKFRGFCRLVSRTTRYTLKRKGDVPPQKPAKTWVSPRVEPPPTLATRIPFETRGPDSSAALEASWQTARRGIGIKKMFISDQQKTYWGSTKTSSHSSAARRCLTEDLGEGMGSIRPNEWLKPAFREISGDSVPSAIGDTSFQSHSSGVVFHMEWTSELQMAGYTQKASSFTHTSLEE